ncbi:anaerobic ribonucleoside-triphosphate reductase activating protein [Treponema pectinovorum]|uniref:anaerobic ribonucleoside-triphosphate reductase activating protein n=1 Tax=Treponema pectinovorum TaxID=164 RepID=UPI0011CA0148|nr:anaerobic ribonucleoside-triphosphate reductase activating protein [Treponema pectinovorum]
MYYGEIKKIDIANGLGVRVSLFVSGCRNKCPGCFNQMTWDFKYGKLFTKETEDEIIEALKPDHIAGLTVLGGEPFEEENQRVLTPFLERVRQIYPQKNIWCYSGYMYDKDLLPKDGKKHCEVTDRMLACIDVLIDGPFIIELKDITLNYRGSSNQRILWLKEDKPINSI